jgi:hypothetical protein
VSSCRLATVYSDAECKTNMSLFKNISNHSCNLLNYLQKVNELENFLSFFPDNLKTILTDSSNSKTYSPIFSNPLCPPYETCFIVPPPLTDYFFYFLVGFPCSVLFSYLLVISNNPISNDHLLRQYCIL